MRSFFLALLFVSACTNIVEDLPSIKESGPTSRVLTCPGSQSSDFCILFEDSSVATISFEDSTMPTVKGKFMSGDHAFPITATTTNEKYTLYFCPATASRLSESTLLLPVTPAGGEALFSFKLGAWEANRVAIRARSFARGDFPATTTAPIVHSSTGNWQLYEQPVTATPVWISQHDTMLLFFFSDVTPCNVWYGYYWSQDTRQFNVPNGSEGVPDYSPQTFGYFAGDFSSGVITTTTSSISGEGQKTVWDLKRK